MSGRRLTIRGIALLGAGSAAIHQLRYAIGYGDAAPHALAAHGHGYLEIALPGVLTAALIALAGMLMRAAGARRERSASLEIARGGSFAALWLASALALATIYGVQETLEGAGALAGSGWIGLALAVPAGLLIALAMRGAAAADELRIAGAALRVFAIATGPLALRPDAVPRLVALRRFGARAPPTASTV